MIDKLCNDLERKALDQGHDIGDGFAEKTLFMVPTLQMSCSRPGCQYLAVMDPKSGRHIECNGGPCRGTVTKCPICQCFLRESLACPECGRGWELTGDYEFPLMSKPRKVKLVKSITVGANLDDCIKPAED